MRSHAIHLTLFLIAVCVHSASAGVIGSDNQNVEGSKSQISLSMMPWPGEEMEKSPAIRVVSPTSGMFAFSISDQCPQTQAVVSRSGLICNESGRCFQSRVHGAHLPDRIPVSLLKVPIFAFHLSNGV